MYDDKYNFCENAPGDFSFCLNADCASAGECLRGLAARDLTEKMVVVSVINPLLVDSMGVSNEHWRRWSQGKFAWYVPLCAA